MRNIVKCPGKLIENSKIEHFISTSTIKDICAGSFCIVENLQKTIDYEREIISDTKVKTQATKVLVLSVLFASLGPGRFHFFERESVQNVAIVVT